MTELGIQVDEIVQNTAAALLAGSAAPCASGDPSGLMAEVEIRGGWDGVVQVVCQPELATHLAAAMFGIAIDRVSSSEARDAVAELANIIGGNVKALVAPPEHDCSLSLPHMVDHLRDHLLLDAWFELPGGRLCVRIHPRQ